MRGLLCGSIQAFSSTKALILLSPESSRKKLFPKGLSLKGKLSLVTLHNCLRQGHLFTGLLPTCSPACGSRIQPALTGWGCGLQGASLEKRQLTEALPSLCTVTPLWRSFHLPLSSGRPPPWLREAIPSIQGRAGSLLHSGGQIRLPVDSSEKHIIFLCHDQNVSVIYHPLPGLGLLLKSVLFRVLQYLAFFLTVLF